MLTENDYKILASILDKSDKTKGLKASNGTTIEEIRNKTKLSERKIRDTKDKFIKLGFIREGIKNRNTKTYLMTKSGMEELKNVSGVIK